MRNPFGAALLFHLAAAGVDNRQHAALEMLSGFATAPGAAGVALTMAGQDKATVRSSGSTKSIKLLTYWTVSQAAGFAQVISPRIHDVKQGIRSLTTTQSFAPSMPWTFPQPMYQNDNLTINLAGSAVGGQIEQMSLLMYYDSLDGSVGRFLSPDDLTKRGVNMMTVRTTHAFGAAGGYSGAVAINSTDDNGKAGKDYALIGYKVSALCGAIGYTGIDTGNLRVGGPGYVANHRLTEEWFVFLSKTTGLPLIPIINWTNKNNLTVDGTQDNNGTAVTVQSYLVELA